MTTVYADITEIISSIGMNIIVILGIIVDYRMKRKDENEKKRVDEDDDIPICFI